MLLTNNHTTEPQKFHRNTERYLTHFCASVALLWFCGVVHAAVSFEREPMTLRVVAVNPSSEKSQAVPVRIDLPQEVGPGDILEVGDLEVEFDMQRSQYYVFKNDVTLAPKQTRVFEVLVRDVWFIPELELSGLRDHTQLVLTRLEQSEYYDAAKQLAESIFSRLDAIVQVQSDDAISRKQRIGAYRRNLELIGVIKEDIARLEKLLSFTGGPPIPQMLEESPLKSDAPSTTTTWLVIFLIVVFMGLLAGQFFFTWQRRLKISTDFSEEQKEAFPESQGVETGGRSGEPPTSS
jgi:hypothetical protein